MKVWIGNVYMDSKLYDEDKDKASVTANKALVNSDASFSDTISNRRTIKGVLNEKGSRILRKISTMIQNKLNVTPKFFYSVYAGCSCPCSPGFKVMLELSDDKSLAVKELFTKYGKLQKWNGRSYEYRPNDVGISYWGQIKKGKEIYSNKQKENRNVFKHLRQIIK